MRYPRTRALAAALLSFVLATSPSSQTEIFTIEGQQSGGGFSLAVGGRGDVDNDGHDDFLVGAPTTFTSVSNSGSVTVYSGKNGTPIHTVTGTQPFEFFGSAVAFVGDIDKDGRDDFAVGARGDDTFGPNTGAVHVYSGFDASVIYSVYGDMASDALGSSVAAAGDVDKDNYVDFVVGLPGNDSLAQDGGAIRIYSGRFGVELFEYHGDGFNDSFGMVVAPAGDFDGDGYDDVLATSMADSVGSATIISGKNGQMLISVDGAYADEGFGLSAALVGDTDGDGTDDFLVGAPFASQTLPGAGAARLFSGADGTVLRWFGGVEAGDFVGYAVAPAGDVDGDGYADVAIGSPGRDLIGFPSGGNGGGGNGGGDGGGDGDDGIDGDAAFADDGGPPSPTLLYDVGEVRIFSGKSGKNLYTIPGDGEGDLFGWSLALIGDANRDQVPDFIVGSILADRGLLDNGFARAVSGRALSLRIDDHNVSLSAGGVRQLTLEETLADAGQLYWFAGSISGTYPGVSLSIGTIPLNPDAYTKFHLNKPFATMSAPFGFLDANGTATCDITIPAGAPADLSGLTLYHAYGVIDLASMNMYRVSNAVPLNLLD